MLFATTKRVEGIHALLFVRDVLTGCRGIDCPVLAALINWVAEGSAWVETTREPCVEVDIEGLNESQVYFVPRGTLAIAPDALRMLSVSPVTSRLVGAKDSREEAGMTVLGFEAFLNAWH
jgi:hypothetical protein